MTPELQAIITATLPAFHANIRHLTRKEWAVHVRALLKEMGIKGVSVTTENYSMTQSIRIRLPRCNNDEHEPIHFQLEAIERAKPGPYNGMVKVCPYCKEHWQAHNAMTAIILSAFPDLENRSDLQSDYFDYCLSID